MGMGLADEGSYREHFRNNHFGLTTKVTYMMDRHYSDPYLTLI